MPRKAHAVVIDERHPVARSEGKGVPVLRGIGALIIVLAHGTASRRVANLAVSKPSPMTSTSGHDTAYLSISHSPVVEGFIYGTHTARH